MSHQPRAHSDQHALLCRLLHHTHRILYVMAFGWGGLIRGASFASMLSNEMGVPLSARNSPASVSSSCTWGLPPAGPGCSSLLALMCAHTREDTCWRVA